MFKCCYLLFLLLTDYLWNSKKQKAKQKDQKNLNILMKQELILASTSAMKASKGSSSLSESAGLEWNCWRVGEFSAGM